MILKEKQNTVEHGGNGPIKTVGYRIDQSAINHIATIMSSMYSRPEEAVVREYLSNAVDGHILNNVPISKIEVYLPTPEYPTFEIRDYGPGLNQEDLEKHLFGYGSSGQEKRESNAYIGAFGIGSKCAYAVTDSFFFISYHQGRRMVYRSYVTETGAYTSELLKNDPTSEASGILVQIPCTTQQCEVYAQAYIKLTDFMPELPVVKRGETALYKFVTDQKMPHCFDLATRRANWISSLWNGEIDVNGRPVQWSLHTRTTDDYGSNQLLVAGWIAYSINTSALGQAPTNESTLFTKTTAQNTCVWVLRCPIGLVPLAPTREELQYSQYTQRLLHGIQAAVYKDWVSKVQQRLDQLLQGGITVTKARQVHQVIHQFALIPNIPALPAQVLGRATCVLDTKCANLTLRWGALTEGYTYWIKHHRVYSARILSQWKRLQLFNDSTTWGASYTIVIAVNNSTPQQIKRYLMFLWNTKYPQETKLTLPLPSHLTSTWTAWLDVILTPGTAAEVTKAHPWLDGIPVIDAKTLCDEYLRRKPVTQQKVNGAPGVRKPAASLDASKYQDVNESPLNADTVQDATSRVYLRRCRNSWYWPETEGSKEIRGVSHYNPLTTTPQVFQVLATMLDEPTAIGPLIYRCESDTEIPTRLGKWTPYQTWLTSRLETKANTFGLSPELVQRLWDIVEHNTFESPWGAQYLRHVPVYRLQPWYNWMVANVTSKWGTAVLDWWDQQYGWKRKESWIMLSILQQADKCLTLPARSAWPVKSQWWAQGITEGRTEFPKTLTTQGRGSTILPPWEWDLRQCTSTQWESFCQLTYGLLESVWTHPCPTKPTLAAIKKETA